ncbi:DNA resolvase [Burkholderia ubonensis]|uniref:recombinase family protein n=1 Tax=Burkholderia ubonensis TaxID=101571 RepID=UPI00075AFFC5|nr:recombinase family protein [Burkholderia ubonensis]KVV44983.1 DNA resolvase [Burkholderia ubonensis]KVW23817.1 DNA resolvase [Burkholderia ubonensis]
MKESEQRIGYARVSTDDQHLDMQIQALKKYGCESIYSDKGISGARFDRPGLKTALEQLSGAGTLVVWRLDRIGRSLNHLANIVIELDRRNIRLVSLTEYIDTRSSSGRFTFHMLAALAEFERGLISERTRAGMAAARARGSNIGRPSVLSPPQIAEARMLLKEQPAAIVAKRFNVHQCTLRRILRDPKEMPLDSCSNEVA